MRVLHACVLTVLALACCVQAGAARRMDGATGRTAAAHVMTGRLELVWGDPGATAKASQGPGERLHVTLVDDAGGRHALDPEQALHAAEDLYALYGRRIAVSTTATASKTSGLEVRVIDAIVPIDDLVPESSALPTTSARVAAQGGQKITGVTTWITLMCKFSDIATEQKTLSFFQSQYGTAIGQLDHYWQEVSYGQINLAGSIANGWASLPEPRSGYVTKDDAGKDKADLGKLFTDCVAAHDANVNFAVNGGVQGVNMMFNGDLDGYAWGGGRCAILDGISKCWSTTWNPPWSFGNLAPLSHEMGHAYGLPHANNSDGDSNTYDNPWDVMSDSWSNAVSDATYGSLPKHINAYSRNRLGWVAAARKRTIGAGTGTASVTMDRISLPGSSNTQMLVLNYPEQSTRYYTVEVRKRGGSYENRLAGDAVIIHEVQTSRSEPSWSMDADKPPANTANNEGSMFKVGETWISPDYAFRLTVQSQTSEGFVLKVRPAPRMSRPAPSQAATAKPAAAAGLVLDRSPTRGAPPRDTDRLGERR